MKCGYCGKEFEDKHGNQLYCSSICRTKANYKYQKRLQVKQCVICGKEFKTAKADKKICSSINCYRKWKKQEKKEKHCLECGAIFYTDKKLKLCESCREDLLHRLNRPLQP